MDHDGAVLPAAGSRIRVWAPLLNAVLAAIVYVAMLRNGFTFDDFLVVGDNPRLGATGFFSALFSPRYFQVSGEATYRPVVTALYGVLACLFGRAPFVFHLASLLLHASVAAGLTRLAQRWRLGPWALWAGAACAVHPILTEAVCGIGFMEDLILAAAVVGALVVATGERPGTVSRYGVTAALFLVALFAKESGVALLIVLPAALALQPGGSVARGVRAMGWLLPVAGLFLLVRFCLLPGHGAGAQWLGGSPVDAFRNAVVIVMEYLVRLIWPVTLSVLRVPASIESWADPRLALAGLTHTCLLVSCVLAFRRLPAWSFGILWFYAAVAPVSNLAPLWHPEADRYLYLPAAGFLLALAGLARGLSSDDRMARWVALPGAVLLVAWSVRTTDRIRDWRSNETLWGHELALQPDHPGVLAENAIAANHRGDYVRAEQLAQAALDRDPANDLARFQLGKSLIMRKRYAAALPHYRVVTRRQQLQPHHLRDAWFDLGYLWEQGQGFDEQAAEAYRQALRVDPSALDAVFNLGALLVREGKKARALEVWEAALRYHPDNADLRHNIGVCRRQLNPP